MTASEAQHRLYRDFVDRLLYQETCRGVREAVRNAKNLDATACGEALTKAEQEAEGKGWLYTAELVRFVRAETADLLSDPVSAPAAPAEVTDLASLIAAAEKAPNGPRLMHLLRKHRTLVTPELYERVLHERVVVQETLKQRPFSLEALRLLFCVALMLKEPAKEVEARVLWASMHRRAGRFINAERHLRRAVATAEKGADERTRLMALGAQGGFYRVLHDMSRAIEAFERCLELAGNDSAATISISESLGSCYREAGQPARAVDALDRGLRLLEEFQFPEPERYLRFLELRGLCYEDLGRYERGRADHLRAAELAARASDRGGQFVAMNNAAASLLKRGLMREGYHAFRDVLRQVEGWGNPIMIASAHNNLGQALLQLERYAEARDHYRKSLAIRINTGLHEGEIISFVGMGDASEHFGEYEAARNWYTFGLVPALESRDDASLTLLQMRLANERLRGDQGIEETIDSLRSARDLARSQSHLILDLSATSQIADLYAESGELEKAIAELEAVLARPIDPEIPNLVRLQVSRARLLARLPERWAEGFAILGNLLSSVECRLKETVLDARRAEIVEEMINIYEAMLALLAEAPLDAAIPENKTREEYAFDLQESAKSRSTLAGLADAPIPPPPNVPEDLRETERRLLENERRLQEQSQEGGEVARLEKLAAIRQELAGCWARMQPLAPNYVRYRRGDPYRFAEIAAWLERRQEAVTAALSLFCERDAVTAFVLRPGEAHPQLFRLALGREQLRTAAKELRRAFNGNPNEFPPYPPIRGDAPFRRKLDFLDPLSRAFAPVWEGLEGVDLVCVAPHGPLHLIPLHALQTGTGYVAERWAVVYTPSLSVSLQLSSRTREEQTQDVRVLAIGVSSADDVHPEFFEDEGDLFEGTGWSVTPAFGVHGASRESALERWRGHTIIHFSCHGFFDERNPLRSGLVLSNDHSKAPRDLSQIAFLERRAFLLTAGDLLRAGFSAELVSLSACSSGLQRVRSGDELDGFSRALLLSGASATVLGMWNLDQESSREFFRNFYRHLSAGKGAGPKWRALHATQQEFISSSHEVWQHPYHWAPYMMIGDWREL